MACKKITKTNGSESELITTLESIYENEFKAEAGYSYFESDAFISEFGDYIKGYEEGDPSFNGRVDNNGEPKLHYNEAAKKYYFINEKKEEVFYPLIKRGLRATFNYKQIDKIVSRLALNYFSKSKLNFNNIKFEEGEKLPNLKLHVKTELVNKINELKSGGLKEKMSAKLLEKTLDNLDEYVEKIDAFYKQVGIKRVDNVDDIGLDTKDDNQKDPSFNKQSFEKDVKESLTTNMKLRLSLLINDNDLDPIWNEPTFIEFNEAHSTLLNNITNQVASEGEDLFELQRDKITLLSTKKLYLKQLLSYMDKFTEEDKNQFAQAFNLHSNNILVSEVKTKFNVKNNETGETETKKGFKHTVKQISESGSKASLVTSEWGNNFKNSFLDDKNKLTAEAKTTLTDIIEKLETLKSTINEDLTVNEFSKHNEKYTNLLRTLGVELTENGLYNFLDENGKIAFDVKSQINKLSTAISQTIIASKKAFKTFSKDTSEYKNPFDAESVFKNLAKAESFFMSEGSDSSIYSSGKNKWLYSYPSYLSSRILQWKKNPELLRNWYNQSAYNRGSELMKYLLALDLDQNKTYDDNYVDDLIKERLENFRLGIFDSFKEDAEKGQQQTSSDLSFKDYITDNVNKVLSNSYVRTTTPADKGSDLQLKTGLFVDSFLDMSDDTIQFTEKIKDVFFNYINSEINRMKEASAEVDTLKFTPEKLIINYHYKEGSAVDAKNGNAFQSQYFPELSFTSDSVDERVLEIKNQLYNNDGSIKHTSDVSANFQLKELITDYVTDMLREGITDTFNNLLQQEVLEINDQGLYVNKSIDSEIYKKYLDKNLLNSEQAVTEMVTDYYLNSLIQNIEYSKMFTGDVAFYKNMIDYKKRVPATYTDGLQLRLKEGESHFTVATIDKVEVGSPFYEELVETLGKKGAEPYGLNDKGKGNINSADAQAWITPKRWKFLVERLGLWTADHTSLYNKMMSENEESFTAKELKIAAQPLKGVYFYMNGKTPTYLKYSQAVLTPNMTKNTPGLRTILNQMNDQNVDELITLDGFKVGSPTPTKIHNTDNTVKKDIAFNTTELSNYGWKLQQNLPVKGAHQTDVGSQIQKNIFAGLIHNLELAGFNLDGSETNGQTISNNIVDVVSGLVDKGIKDIKEEFDVFRNGEIKNIKGFYNALVRELEQRGGSQNVIDALNKKIALYGLPQSMDKLISVFSSVMNDRLIKIKTNGGSFIQMSNFGISKEEGEGKGIMWNPDIENGTGAYEPHIYTNEKGRKTIKPAGILISGSFIAKLIPDYKKYTAEELFKGVDGNPPIIDKKILNTLVGYRIPNQGLSSNDALEIIGILPEENGDTVVAYTGITTKTGSDFDIDKMYVMMANYDLIDDKLVYTEYDKSLSNNKQSKEALQNRLIELYKSVLTHPKVIKDVMKPLDNDVLKNDIIDLIPVNTKGTMFHFDAFNDIKLRYEFILGKAGVGQEANAVVDINRPGKLSINRYNLGWGHVNEKNDTKLDEEYSESLSDEDLNYYVKQFIKSETDVKRINDFKNEVSKLKIGDSLTAILNAFVDIAKDPYITRGNWTTSTTNTGNLLIRAGVHPLYVTAFMAQPIIKEYIEYQASKESIITKNTGDIKNKFKKDLVINNLIKLNEEHPELSKPLEILYQKFVKSATSINPFTATGADEKLQKLLGKKNTLSDEELNKVLTVLKNEHNRVFNAEKIEITDRSKYNLQHYRNQIKNETTSDFQIAILDKFYELQEISKAVKENVDISKLDTNGVGKNINSLFSTFNLIQHVFDKEKTNKIGVLNGMQSKFENTTLEAYHKGLKEIMRIVQSNPLLFPQANTNVQEMFNEISMDVYDEPAIDEKLMTDLEKSYYTYVMSNFTPFNFSSTKANDLLNVLPTEFNDFKKANKGKYFFIDELQFKTKSGSGSITLNNRKKSNSFEKKFTDSWRDLTIDNPELAEKLIKYSFLTSGFKMNTGQFFTYIPHEYLLQNNINQFIVGFSKQEQSDFIDKFYLNNSGAFKYVNKVFDSEIQSEDVTSGFILNKTNDQGKAKYYVSRDTGGGIYKLEGYDSSNRAIYTRIIPLGKSTENINVVEYGEPFLKSDIELNQEFILKLKNSVVTERNRYNPNFTLAKIEDREEDEISDDLNNLHKIKTISDAYGVVTVDTNPSSEKTQQFIGVIQPQIQNQAYKENASTTANDMFMYGLRWTRKSKAKSPLNNKSYANKGLPITDAKAKDGYVYDTVDQNGKPLAPMSDLQPIINEIQNTLGLDMSDYDAVIGNIYLPGQNIATHRDTTESLSAKNYPVVVYTIGNDSGISVYENEKEPGSASFASDKKTTINTKNGSIYTFGMGGKGRFEVAHDTPKGIKRDVEFPPITMPNGKVITNYTITLTFRRAADLTENIPVTPNRSGKIIADEMMEDKSVTAELTPGQYVKYNGETYIIVKQNANGTIQILNPTLEGPLSKISVAKTNLTAIGKEAKIVTYKGAEYLVTPSNNIISATTGKAMKWAENDGNRRTILELANNNIVASNKVEISTITPPVLNKPKEVVQFKPANKEQEVAIEAIKDFIENGNPKEIFILEGKAGTGKTTLIQEALADSVDKGKNIHIAALSHKAKLVLAQKLDQRFPNKISSNSIAGLLGMKMNEETGEFTQGSSFYGSPIDDADIIVIDEASMVNEEALSLIMGEKKYGTKVIFLGDRGQLPPIRKIASDEISAVFESPNKASLVERVRQGEESPILPFADYFWDNSESDKPKTNPIPEGQIKDSLTSKGNLVFINSLFDVFDDIVKTFKQGVESKNFNVIKIVTYKNATRQNYNNKIRKAVFGQDVAQFVEKDQIMFQNNYSSNNVEFSNSDEFSIESVMASEKNGYKIFELGVKIDPTKDIITYFPVLAEEDKSKFNEEISRLFEVAKKMSPGQARKIAYQKAWSLKGSFAEIDYAYAITSHKSQGSTYDNVIVDLKDIYSVGATTNASKSRSAYTGLTRAKNTAIIITSKAETNNDNVKKALTTIPQTTLTEAEKAKADEFKKYCNPS